MKISGKVSHFGGPADTGVTSSEDLAFWEEYSQVAHPEQLFLPAQPSGTTGLARRLDPQKHYIACRWDYDVYPKSELKTGDHLAMVRSPKTGHATLARPADWGPNENTNRVADISPGLMEYLQITTDDVVEVIYPFGEGEEEEVDVAIHTVCISAGHGKKIAGASGYFEENVETPKVMREVSKHLRDRGVVVFEFWDQTSTSVDANLDAIVDWHNSLIRDLDVSCHFNASDEGEGHGVEVLYLTQKELAAKVSKAIADISGLTNRGAKYDTRGLKFLRATEMPAILIETCFCDNKGDSGIYKEDFADICEAIAAAISGLDMPKPIEPPIEPPVEPPEQVTPVVTVALTVPDGVNINITVNGNDVLLD